MAADGLERARVHVVDELAVKPPSRSLADEPADLAAVVGDDARRRARRPCRARRAGRWRDRRRSGPRPWRPGTVSRRARSSRRRAARRRSRRRPLRYSISVPRTVRIPRCASASGPGRRRTTARSAGHDAVARVQLELHVDDLAVGAERRAGGGDRVDVPAARDHGERDGQAGTAGSSRRATRRRARRWRPRA